MQYGFVIDHDACIGCHACTVACKAENSVPVGSFRTSVKYTERGSFPDVKRSFLVQRCNHCTDAPCVTICPVKALEKRDDGIVDIDRDACIGCRACMQACPYDALYLNDDLNAVEKCHFCAHRVDQGLAPACVNVCPVNAIIPGDFDDPESKVSLLVLNNDTAVRRPEQETGPNVQYIGADPVALTPGEAERPEMYLWSDRSPHKSEPWPDELKTVPDARTVLDTGHRVEWGWPVSLYLVTKGVAAGGAALAPLAAWLGLTGGAGRWAPEIFSLVFLAITCFLLVEDLKKPWAFYRLLTRPNWDSWLVRGGIILSAGMGVSAATIAAHLLDQDGIAQVLRWINIPVGLAVAGYTAFLFRQCKGRDLWEGPLLLPHLLVQAVLCGVAVLLPFVEGMWSTMPEQAWGGRILLIAAALAHGGFALLERHGSHPTSNAKQGAAFLGTVRLGRLAAFRGGLLMGVALAVVSAVVLPGFAFIPVLLGLFLYEHAYVRAGQLPPLS